MKTSFQRLQAIVARDYKLDIEKVTPETSLDALGIDSLGVAEMLFNIEDEFQVSLPAEPVQGLATVGDVARFIDGLIAERPKTLIAAVPGSQGETPIAT